ncbi:hypothetical protein AK812_SmicGene34362 [Symbiodinium microadriaticum]|uniref:Uncharacterized protein n=1 Tax=Symbiodinium microadriaticum TaxID=2951 RepID=A0A1Q9CP74_SYMMI|nr:hypothetical protein AK812_SmicGene34362 [Symbiodinium microadriaticum]
MRCKPFESAAAELVDKSLHSLKQLNIRSEKATKPWNDVTLMQSSSFVQSAARNWGAGFRPTSARRRTQMLHGAPRGSEEDPRVVDEKPDAARRWLSSMSSWVDMENFRSPPADVPGPMYLVLGEDEEEESFLLQAMRIVEIDSYDATVVRDIHAKLKQAIQEEPAGWQTYQRAMPEEKRKAEKHGRPAPLHRRDEN